ncbi:MAG: AzlD domain-containing protein [Armatimonadota bacterium]
MTVWLLIAGMGLITYALRLSVIALLGRLEMPAIVLRALRFVPVAVLSAIIAPEVLAPGGALDMSLGNARVPAAIVAAVIAWRTRNVFATIGAGMAVLWILQGLRI